VGDEDVKAEQFAEAIKELHEAEKAYTEAQRSESMARSRCCEATNRLNEAQKQVDSMYMRLKSNTPSGDWKR
jgi:hypothetical protein